MVKKVAFVACSNGRSFSEKEEIKKLKEILAEGEMIIEESPYLYAENGIASGTPEQRAEILNQFYRDDTIEAIFDLSGGDLANEILPYIDYDAIAKSNKLFYGYSDLTTVINAIYTRTGKSSVLFQLKTLVWDQSGEQLKRWDEYLQNPVESELVKPKWEVLQGVGTVEEILKNNYVIGGNIRCFLKLAGTKYFPDTEGKILFLEALSGGVPQISAYMAQLYQLGVLEKVKAVLLGTFTEMEREQYVPTVYEIMRQYLPEKMLVAKTSEVGHTINSKALIIG